MKNTPMIIAIIVSIVSAQGIVAQDDLAYAGDFNALEYGNETQQYTEIEVIDLPMVIQDAAVRDFNNLRISRAYISKDNTYKIILKGDDNYTKVVFASANGEWISSNDKS